jgi:hypothetical protein
MNFEPLLNDFATRSFRDVGDQDYISARMAYRASLYSQFHWAGLQAIEKYLKAILLYNRIQKPKRRIGHDLARALECAEQLPFEIKLSKPSRDIIEHLDTYGRFRYLESSYHVFDRELLKLDKAVWEIRRYCRVINYKLKVEDQQVEMLALNLAEIEASDNAPPQNFKIIGGMLENILDKKDHPARAALVWKNMFFNRHNRKGTKFRNPHHATNAPLSLRPELLTEVMKYVWLPQEVVTAYEAEMRNRAKIQRPGS